jgi:outer membrane protein assembly factor BamA
MGDIAFESNIEYRFPIYKILDGALFIDAGNVWLLKENAEFDGGKFRFDKAPGEIAIGSGIGARFNFGFFIVRFDAAIPLKDPSKPVGQRWLFNNLSFNKIIGNIGIGYPF